MDYALDGLQLHLEPGNLLLLNVILALLMLGVALDLTPNDFRAVARSPKGPLVGIATQLLLLPAATFALIQVLQPIPSVKLGMLLVAACPGGNVSNFLVWLARGNTALSVSMTAVSSSVAVFTTPLNLAFWASLDADTRGLLSRIAVDPLDMFLTISLLLALPLAVGMLLRHHYPQLSTRIRRPLRVLGGVVFLGFIVFAFYQGRENLTSGILPVLVIVVIHNAMAIGLGYAAARLLRLEPRDRRAVSIEVGIQNSGLGLALVLNFFVGLGGAAMVVAWWGTWHLVGGFAVAMIWSQLARRQELREQASAAGA